MHHQHLLNQPLKELPFSDHLKQTLNASNIFHLSDLLQIHAGQWHHSIPGFTMHHQHEIIRYLTQNNLEKFLKQK